MKNLIYFLAGSIISVIVFSVCVSVAENKKIEDNRVSSIMASDPSRLMNIFLSSNYDPLVIKYSEYNGYPVELEYDSLSQMLCLRVEYNKKVTHTKGLEFLKSKAFEICNQYKVFSIGRSGYSLKYLGGSPKNIDFLITHYGGNKKDYIRLIFSDNISLENNVLLIKGSTF